MRKGGLLHMSVDTITGRVGSHNLGGYRSMSWVFCGEEEEAIQSNDPDCKEAPDLSNCSGKAEPDC